MSEREMAEICGNCGMSWGHHAGTRCPGKRGEWEPKESIQSKMPKAQKTYTTGGPTIREWVLTEPDEVLELANKIYDSMLIREKIPMNKRPKMVLLLEVHDGKRY